MQPMRILRGLITLSLCCVIFVQSVQRSPAAGEQNSSAKSKPRSNRLAKETSPYLLLHAHNPVDWYPWGPEAFEKAKKEGKLVFLSVGYSSCYWCHVMERKVFSNEAIAKTLNQDYVCIKVDREERPDVDDIYMTALQVYYQAIGAPSSGGWPLSMFLTPDGKPVAGGTYFPPDDTAGNEGFPTILSKLTDLWKNKHDQMLANADILSTEVRRIMRPKVALTPIEINEKLASTVFSAIVASFDPVYGGIDFNAQKPDGPKFPTPSKLIFIQQQLQRTPDSEVAKQLDLTLMQLACGGIRDHIGGGFHRYSVDRRWNVPHFEKMLYDQAQLADLFVEAYRTTQKPIYKQVADEIFDFVKREMTSPEGGFYSALDAETDGVEGAYYVWDATEVDNLLGTTAQAFKDTYRINDLPDFEHGNVLRLSMKRLPKPAAGDTVIGTPATASSQRDEYSLSRQKLLDVRNKRKKPLRDEKVLTCWNGEMIAAYARAGEVFQNPEYKRTAERAASFVLAKLRDPQGRLLHSYTSGQSKLNAYLDDYAFMVDALLALHDATDDPKWLKSARQLQDDQLRLFLDDTNGGFYFTSHQHEELLARTKNCYDGVLPAGNSVSARNLIKLAKKTATPEYRDEARATIESFAPDIQQTPRGFAFLALAATELLELGPDEKAAANDNPKQVVPVAANDNKQAANEPLILLANQKDPKKKDEFVRARAYLSTDKLPAGNTCQVVVLIDVDKEWHVNANPPDPDYLIPIKVSIKSNLGITVSEPKYPAGHSFKFKDDPTPVMAYEGEVAIRGTLTVPEKLSGQMDDVEIVIEYQACHQDGKCLPPKTIKLSARLPVSKRGETVKYVNTRLFTAPAVAPSKNAEK